MLAAFTDLKNAQKVKKQIIQKKAIHPDYLSLKELDHIYFPLSKKITIKNAKIVNTKFKFELKPSKITIESILKDKLTKKELKIIPRSQEIIGDIMILEVPKELVKKEKDIARAYLQLNKNIVTVVKKKTNYDGVFRTRKVKHLLGDRKKETTNIENGAKIKLHLEEVYYSARSASERLRIAKLVKKGESILIMFSGAGPFPVVIGKNSSPKKIIAVELNPQGHYYADQNIKINKLDKLITLYNKDVREIVPKLKGKFDRIAMPLPKTGEEFLDIALKKIKPKGTIHLYAFLNEKDIKDHVKKIRQICKDLKFKIRIKKQVKCGQFSPGTFRMCFDLSILEKIKK
jgi:tRNA (guanine37-N1)-methyltransferase